VKVSRVTDSVTRGLAILMLAGAAASAQAPVVGDINFYGLHKLTPERILGAVNLKPGMPLPRSKGDLEDRIGEISGVVLARVDAVCCEGNATALFIGIEERGGPHAAFRSEPSGDAKLPETLVGAYTQFLAAVQSAASRGNAAEDLTAGHSMMADPGPRKFQEQFVAYATEHADVLRNVQRNASDPNQRAIAGAVIGYAPHKQDVVNDLQYAMQDPDESVRANAMRGLTAIAVLASKQPTLGIKISATWFIEMLNSVVLSDRIESTKALLTVTDRHVPAIIEQIRERALPALAEMARWKTLSYALPPYLLLGRAAGIPEDQIQKSWAQGQRETVIEKALATVRKR
jgi:hypothetical protein